MSSEPTNSLEFILKEETHQDTLLAISELIVKLMEIYQHEFPNTFPNELLQEKHGFHLLSTVFSKQAENPSKLLTLQADFAMRFNQLYLSFIASMYTLGNVNFFPTPSSDRRFSNQVWRNNPYFEFLSSSYELLQTQCYKWLNSLEGLDRKTKQQLNFYITNILDYIAPTNNMFSNPEVMEAILETGGHNLLKGYRNYLEDLVLNNGKMNVRMTDLKAFQVGKNLACTPGKVVFQNDLIQLIQYAPTTSDVYSIPILITPPYINKYYVLDLSPKNSLVKWLVERGFTVFIISWVNPGKELSHKDFEDYMQEGPLQALDVVSKITGSPKVHMAGYCIGGTLLSCALAYLKAKNDKRVASATFLMSLVNFSNPGEIGVFLDEDQIDGLETLMKSQGYLNGHLLDITFNMLRPNDLIWPYFINNYLLGKPSKPFDILYWNADSSNLPYKMYIFYLRNMYLHNRLHKPGGITLKGVPIDLSIIDCPTFFLGAESDHITLWKALYSGIHCFKGANEFVLTESGHVRGVLNPPGDTKYGFHANKNNKHLPETAHEWLQNAQKHEGSWWPYWEQWLLSHDKAQVPARMIDPKLIIENAPGSYVLKRL